MMLSALWLCALAIGLLWIAWCSVRARPAAERGPMSDTRGVEHEEDEGPPLALMSSSDNPRGPGRRPKGGRPLDKETARKRIFERKSMFRKLLDWLERLRVSEREREDVAQQVLTEAWESWPSYDPVKSRPERWLNRIAVNVAAHHRDLARHRRERVRAQPIGRRTVDPAPDAPTTIAEEERRLAVLDVLQALDPQYRAIIIAHDIDDIPMAEIAAQYGLPLSTAYKWHTRARNAFAEEMERREREEDERLEDTALLDRP